MPVAEPHMELRFTRARQAVGFWIAAAMLVMAALVFALLAPHRADNPQLPSPWWGLVPLGLGWLAARTAARCTRHAYLILSPLGIEVFPFLRPARGMQLVPWARIAAAEFDEPPTRLTLHYDEDRTSGLHLSLAPIPKPRRPLLARAVHGRLESIAATTTATDPPATIRPTPPS